MKTILLSIAGFVGVILFIYVLWAVFIPMAIGQKVVDRKITQNSQQYVATQRSALVKLYEGYSATDDPARKTAIKGQMCQIATEIPRDEIPDYIRGSVTSCR